MKKKIIITLLLLTGVLPVFSYNVTRPYDSNWYLRANPNPIANTDAMWFQPPKVGEQPKKENKFKLMIYRADKVHPSPRWRYQRHISNREYLDCSYYKYVDCSNYTFCRCWQCRDYIYPFRDAE